MIKSILSICLLFGICKLCNKLQIGMYIAYTIYSFIFIQLILSIIKFKKAQKFIKNLKNKSEYTIIKSSIVDNGGYYILNILFVALYLLLVDSSLNSGMTISDVVSLFLIIGLFMLWAAIRFFNNSVIKAICLNEKEETMSVILINNDIVQDIDLNALNKKYYPGSMNPSNVRMVFELNDCEEEIITNGLKYLIIENFFIPECPKQLMPNDKFTDYLPDIALHTAIPCWPEFLKLLCIGMALNTLAFKSPLSKIKFGKSGQFGGAGMTRKI